MSFLSPVINRLLHFPRLLPSRKNRNAEDDEKQQHRKAHPAHKHRRALAAEHIVVAFQVNDDHNQRQNVLHVKADPVRELDALAFVRFLEEILKAPTVFAHAEQYEHKAAQRQQIGRNKEVFHIHNVAALTQRLNAGKHIKAENRRQGKHRDQHKVHAHSLFAAPTADIHEECENLLKHRNDGRKRRKRHEDEEQRAPNSAARHVIEELSLIHI